ncbi:MAG: 30S ribosomal protein S16 [Patescibacteria group bacterium]|jgi:small subunit ribosomal protein S16
MLSIRLARYGRKNQPAYRVVLQEKDWSPTSKVMEILGHMNPRTNPATVVLKKDRIQYWLSKGAETSATVHNMLVTAAVVVNAPKRRVIAKTKKATEKPAAAPTAKV